MSKCLYQPEPASLECILEVVKDVRNGDITSTTVRKVLKQVDSGLAAFGRPEPVVGTLSEEDLLAQLEAACTAEVTTASPAWLPLLIALLKMLLDQA